MVELVAGGVGPVAAAGGARAECTPVEFGQSHGVGGVGRVLKGDGDRLDRVYEHVAAGVDDVLAVIVRRLACSPPVAAQHPREQVQQISFAARAEIQCDGTPGDQCGAMSLHVAAPGGPAVDGAQTPAAGVGLDGERIDGVVAESDQILAHAWVDGPVGARVQGVVQVEQARCPVGKVEDAAARGRAHPAHGRIVPESGQRPLIRVDERAEPVVKPVRQRGVGVQQQAGAQRIGERGDVRQTVGQPHVRSVVRRSVVRSLCRASHATIVVRAARRRSGRAPAPKRYRADMCATLRRQIAFDRTPYYIVASCFAEQSNIQGAVAQLVERFVRIEEVAVSTTVSSTRPSAFIPPQRVFSFVFVGIVPSRASRG